MSRGHLIPDPIARLPWRVILLIIAIGTFGQIVLYSAAGGSLQPWALSQGIRFFILLGMALAVSYVPERVWRSAALPAGTMKNSTGASSKRPTRPSDRALPVTS